MSKKLDELRKKAEETDRPYQEIWSKGIRGGEEFERLQREAFDARGKYIDYVMTQTLLGTGDEEECVAGYSVAGII